MQHNMMTFINKKRILIGISSSIAAYKVGILVEKLKKSGADVKAVITNNAEKLIKKDKLPCEVFSQLFIECHDYSDYKTNPDIYTHINLAKFPDLIILAPATANIIGKAANGIADDLLSTVLLASKAKIFVCPAMNCNMYENKIVQDNISKLKKAGYHFIGPESGDLACGDKGIGRMSDTDKILDEINIFFEKKDSFRGKKAIVTAGALSEKIDAVRIITNQSSGKMGIAIADELAFRGADVVLIKGDAFVSPSEKMQEINVCSSQELLSGIKKNKDYDIIVHCAAVPDFRVKPTKGKLPSGKGIKLKLVPVKKILDELKKINPKGFAVGFKAEADVSDNKLVDSAFERLKKSKIDLIVANRISGKTSFGSDMNEVFIINNIGGKKNAKKIPLASKKEIADKIADEILLRME